MVGDSLCVQNRPHKRVIFPGSFEKMTAKPMNFRHDLHRPEGKCSGIRAIFFTPKDPFRTCHTE